MSLIEKRVTIKDIAQEAGVSTGTVHRAIYGKKGVTEEVRQRILDICEKRGYRANRAASALKRGQVRIVAAFPSPNEKNRYFYANIWKGFRQQVEEAVDFHLSVIEVPYYEGTESDQANMLDAVRQQYAEEGIDGLLTIGPPDERGQAAVRAYADSGIPVFLACDDNENCGRIACVQADYDVTGRIVAELLMSQLRHDSTVLLIAGDTQIPSHYGIVHGFEAYLQEHNAPFQVCRLIGYADEKGLAERIREVLTMDNTVAAAFSVSARLSVLLANEISELGLQDQVRVVASDLFDETVHNMEHDIVKNIIYKDPEQQAYLATKTMLDYLLQAEKPPQEVQYVESRVIFQSSLKMYL